jgi:recombination associated protein RdgC
VTGPTGELVSEFPTGYALCLRCEEKIVPPGAISSEVNERTLELEVERGEELELEDHKKLFQDVSMEICKKAFVRTKYIKAYHHPESGFLFIDTTSAGAVDRFMNALVKLARKVQTVTIHISSVKNSVTTRLQHTIKAQHDENERPFGKFEPDDMARLRRKLAPGEPIEVVTYKGTWLANNDELLSQLNDGFEVEEIGLTYPPASMSFRLTHQFRFKDIDFQPLEAEDEGAEGDDAHEWGVQAMREVGGMVDAVGELCELMDYEQPVLYENTDPADEAADPLYESAVAHVRETQRPSISALQQQFKVGYNRATKIMLQLERHRIVSPLNEDGRRALIASSF